MDPAVVTPGEPRSVTMAELSPGLLTALGALPVAGRDFIPDDGAAAVPVAIVSDGLARDLALAVGARNGT